VIAGGCKKATSAFFRPIDVEYLLTVPSLGGSLRNVNLDSTSQRNRRIYAHKLSNQSQMQREGSACQKTV